MSPWIKRKPKSHLGILKEEKDQKRIHSFQERLRESKRRRKFPFFWEERAAKKWHEFQGNAGHEFQGSQQRRKSVRIWYSSIYCTCSGRKAARKSKKKGDFISPYSPYGHHTVVVNFWARFSKSVQSVRYGCQCTDFEVAAVGFLPVNFKHENRGKR